MVSSTIQDPLTAVSEVDRAREGAGASTRTAESRKRRRVFGSALVFTLLVLAVTSPALFYAGDSFATRAESVNLLTTGEFGISLARKAELDDFVDYRGQYFFENEARQKLFPKYGVAYTLLYVPPLLLDRAVTGRLELLQRSGTLVILLNLYNLLFAVIIFAYLWRLAALYTQRVWLTAAFVLASIFGTFLWFYLRAPSHEIFQITAFVAFAYHALVYLRRQCHCEIVSSQRHGWTHLLAATICLGLLVHMRFSYALLYGPLWGFAISAERRSEPIGARLRGNLAQFRWQYLWALAVPTAVAFGLLLFAQWWKFGSMFDHGYTQWARLDEDPVFNWPLERVVRTLSVYFVLPGNGNVFLHYPLLTFALFGWVAWWRKHRAEAAFSICVSACVLLPVLNWGMEGHGYGPRYLLPALMLCSAPLLLAYEGLRRWRWRWPAQVAVVCTLAFVLAWSCRMQVYTNSLPFFSYVYVADFFMQEAKGNPAEAPLRRYFKSTHRGSIARDLVVYQRGEREFPPIGILLRHVPQDQRDAMKSRIDEHLQRASVANYLFLCRAASANRAPGD